MKIAALVPLKLNNERVPGKNTMPFTNGKPLCQYLFHTLLAVKEIDRVYAFCSDQSICEYLPKGAIWLPRDPKLDDSAARGIDIVKSFAENIHADIYVLSHVTSPFLTANSICKGLAAVMNEGYDSALSVLRLNEFIWYNGKPLNYDPGNVPRTQDLPEMYMETSGFFIYRRDVVTDHGRRTGFNPKFIEVSGIEALDIDYPEDFSIADSVYNFLLKGTDRDLP